MNQGNPETSGAVKVALGIGLPIAALIVYDLCLFSSVSGKGAGPGLAGSELVFGSAIIIPLLFIVNAFIMIPRWKSKIAIFLMGCIFPAIVAVAEYKFLRGK